MMISDKLKRIFLISIPIFVAHGLEEYLTGLYKTDSHVKFMFRYFASLTPMQATFLMFQIMLWFLLIIGYLLILNDKWRLRLMVIPGIIFIYELHHIYKALGVGGYYPGLITALLFPIIGVYFWKELLRAFKYQ